MTALNASALDTIACPDCDLQQSVPPLLPGGSARCARCRVTIARNPVDPIGRPLALSVAAAVVFLIANTTPLMGLSAVGPRGFDDDHRRRARDVDARQRDHGGDRRVLRRGCAGGVHRVHAGVLLGAKRTPAPRWVGRLLRWAAVVLPWSMTEVMLLGILVALIKIAHLATVIPGIGLFAVGLLVVLLAVTSSIFEPRAIWERVVWANGMLPPALRPRRGEPHRKPEASWVSAHPGLASCTTCGLLSRPAAPDQLGECPRCGARLSARHHFSLQTTWALVIAAAVLFVPANAFPVLVTTTFGTTESSTILGGVVFLYKEGSWVLALIVLVASVVVPIGKLAALMYLMVTVQRGSLKSNHDRTRLYRLVEVIGRWSMLDVFVVAFIVALVQLDPLMSVAPGIGVMYFMAVVVLTMIAAHAFDPRLIWNPGASPRSTNG
jgi:paraquat-inducible protein A